MADNSVLTIFPIFREDPTTWRRFFSHDNKYLRDNADPALPARAYRGVLFGLCSRAARHTPPRLPLPPPDKEVGALERALRLHCEIAHNTGNRQHPAPPRQPHPLPQQREVAKSALTYTFC